MLMPFFFFYFGILLLGFVPQLLCHRSMFLPLPVSWCVFLLLRELVRILLFGTLRGGGDEKGLGLLMYYIIRCD